MISVIKTNFIHLENQKDEKKGSAGRVAYEVQAERPAEP